MDGFQGTACSPVLLILPVSSSLEDAWLMGTFSSGCLQQPELPICMHEDYIYIYMFNLFPKHDSSAKYVDETDLTDKHTASM